MELYGQTSKSIPQKVVIHLIELLLLYLSWWILFGTGAAWCAEHLHIADHASTGRRMVIFIFNIIIFLRLAYMMFFLLRRKIAWEESISVPLAFALYYIGFALFVLPTPGQVDMTGYFAIFLFALGCLLNTGGEVLRDRWKRLPQNKGRLYTGGFFRYSRHINYFGDLLWVIAYAIATRNIFSASIPIFLFCFFAFYNAPKLDQYLKEKYGKEYDDYAARTAMLIPFIF